MSDLGKMLGTLSKPVSVPCVPGEPGHDHAVYLVQDVLVIDAAIRTSEAAEELGERFGLEAQDEADITGLVKTRGEYSVPSMLGIWLSDMSLN